MVGEGRPPPGKRVPIKGFRAVSDERPSEKSAPKSLLVVPNKRNWKVFGRYFFFSLLFLLIGYEARPWGIILVWPAVSLGIVATGYQGVARGLPQVSPATAMARTDHPRPLPFRNLT